MLGALGVLVSSNAKIEFSLSHSLSDYLYDCLHCADKEAKRPKLIIFFNPFPSKRFPIDE